MKKLHTLPPAPLYYPQSGTRRSVCGGIGLLAIALLAIALLASSPAARAAALNDTGAATYGNATANDLTSEPADYPGQDASHGRDAAAKAGILTKVGSGNAGFDFTKIDANGNTLPADAATWSCVQDNATGLVWEVKSDDGGLHDKDWTYSWYNSTGVNDGGSSGFAGQGSCGGTVVEGCDTEKFVTRVNTTGLCGHNDWRLPSSKEQLTIVDNNRTNPAIDTNYFPNTPSAHFWTATPFVDRWGYVTSWFVDFEQGRVDFDHTPGTTFYVDNGCTYLPEGGNSAASVGGRGNGYSVRLVRGE